MGVVLSALERDCQGMKCGKTREGPVKMPTMDYDVTWLRRSLADFIKNRSPLALTPLCEKADVSPRTIGQFLDGTAGDSGPRWDTLVKLATAAGTNVFDMLRPGKGSHVPLQNAVDRDTIEALIAEVYAMARAANSKITPEKLAKGIMLIYDLHNQRSASPRRGPGKIAKEYDNVIKLFLD